MWGSSTQLSNQRYSDMSRSIRRAVIKPFFKQHIDDVIKLWKTIDYLALLAADSPAGIASFLDRNPGCSFIATDGETIVGAILCGSDGRRGHIYHLAVAESYRRQGIAKRLVHWSLSALSNLGIDKCYAVVYRDSPFHALFWSNTGWDPRDDCSTFMRAINRDTLIESH